MECTLWNLKQKSLTKAGERATGTRDCRRVSVQQYSVQCKGYNLIGVTTVEASETRGTTALVYWLINSSLYTGAVQCTCTVQCGGVHPDWFDGQQGCSQLSTHSFFWRMMQRGVKLQIQVTPRTGSKRRKDFRFWIGDPGGNFWREKP
jgi:hypothetical protein